MHLLLLLACSGADPTDTESGPPTDTDTGLAWDNPIFAELGELVEDPTNAVADDPDAAWLGQALFYDTRLSGTGEFSCATCHIPEFGFQTPDALSEAAGTTDRHAPTVLNNGFQDWFFWDGRADSLWAQALKPLEADNEQDTTRVAAVRVVYEDEAYRAVFESLFGALPDLDDAERFPEDARPVTDDPSHSDNVAWATMDADDRDAINQAFAGVGKAIAAYERQLVRADSRFDTFAEAVRDGTSTEGLLTDSELYGLELFLGEGNCHFCHFGPNFSNDEFHNIGLGSRDWLVDGDQGRYDGIAALLQDPFNGAGDYSDDTEYGSLRIDHLVRSAEQLGQFKTPTLRNLAETAPYMHGGHYDTLEEVVTHYARLDETEEVGHREELLVVHDDWGDAEITALVEFLLTLEGTELDPALIGTPAAR